MTYQEAKKRLEDWYEDNTVEISPEFLDCCYNALKQAVKDEMVENTTLDAIFLFNNTEGITELRVPANGIEQRNGWVLALWNSMVVGGAKEEYLKAFHLSPST